MLARSFLFRQQPRRSFPILVMKSGYDAATFSASTGRAAAPTVQAHRAAAAPQGSSRPATPTGAAVAGGRPMASMSPGLQTTKTTPPRPSYVAPSAVPLRAENDEVAQMLSLLAARASAESSVAATDRQADAGSSREAAMQAFAKMNAVASTPKPPATNTVPRWSEADAVLLSDFLSSSGDLADDSAVTPDVLNHLTEYLNSFRKDVAHGEASSAATTPSPRHPPAPTTKVAAAPTPSSDGGVVTPITDKEHRFLSSLIEVVTCFREASVPFFITCGTALGALRERRFIGHDDDIDIGLLFDEVAASPSADGSDDARDRVQSAVMDLLAIAGQRGRLHCFDVLGEIERGFQLRFRDESTGVLIDVNVYYTADDEATGQRYVWSATHYGASQQRKHGMYRYRNSYPLQLRDVAFYNLRLRAPTEQYLEEYFGSDWRVPRVFNYDQGLAGEYKNIIAE